MLCATICRRPTVRARHQSGEHLLQARRATTWRCRGRSRSRAISPRDGHAERQRVAVEPDAVRQAGGIEHGGLECLVEAMDVDQHVARAGRRPRQVADLRHRLDRIEAPIVEPDRGEREPAAVRRREPGVRNAQSLTPVPARTTASSGAPSTGLRLVATRTAGLAEISEASKRVPVDAKLAQPLERERGGRRGQSHAAPRAAPKQRRREESSYVSCHIARSRVIPRAIATSASPGPRLCVEPDRGDNRADARLGRDSVPRGGTRVAPGRGAPGAPRRSPPESTVARRRQPESNRRFVFDCRLRRVMSEATCSRYHGNGFR